MELKTCLCIRVSDTIWLKYIKIYAANNSQLIPSLFPNIILLINRSSPPSKRIAAVSGSIGSSTGFAKGRSCKLPMKSGLGKHWHVRPGYTWILCIPCCILSYAFGPCITATTLPTTTGICLMSIHWFLSCCLPGITGCHKQLLFFYAIPRSSELAPFRHLVVYDAHRSRFFLTQSHRQKTVASMSKGEDHRAIVSWNIAKSHGSLHFGRPSSSSILFDEISHFCRECSFNVPSTSPAHSALFCRPLRDSQRIPHEEAQKMRRCCSAAQQIFKTSWTVQLLPIKENWTFD